MEKIPLDFKSTSEIIVYRKKLITYKCCDYQSISESNTDYLVTGSENACRLNSLLKSTNNENIISHEKINKKFSRDNKNPKNEQKKKAENKYAEQNRIEMRKSKVRFKKLNQLKRFSQEVQLACLNLIVKVLLQGKEEKRNGLKNRKLVRRFLQQRIKIKKCVEVSGQLSRTYKE